MVVRFKNPSRRVLMQLSFLSARRVNESLKTHNGVFQHGEYQSFLRFEECPTLPGPAVFVGRQFVRFE